MVKFIIEVEKDYIRDHADMDKSLSQIEGEKGNDAVESMLLHIACSKLKEKNFPDEIVLRRDMFEESEVKSFKRVLNKTILLTYLTRDDDKAKEE